MNASYLYNFFTVDGTCVMHGNLDLEVVAGADDALGQL